MGHKSSSILSHSRFTQTVRHKHGAWERVEGYGRGLAHGIEHEAILPFFTQKKDESMVNIHIFFTFF